MKFATLVGVVAGLWHYHLASGEVHSLKYFDTYVTRDVDFPEFTTVGLVDNTPFMYYNSRIEKVVPKPWMSVAEEDHWDGETQNEARHQVLFADHIQNFMKRYNHSKGVHTFQRFYGCQWDDESGDIDGYHRLGYDGEDVITLDLKNMRFIFSTPQSILQRYSSGDYIENTVKYYHTQYCIKWMKNYVKYGSSHLKRKVRPHVTLHQMHSGVVCHATGFFPEGVMITWKRDGEEMLEDVDVGETLPNEDETFQKRAVLIVSPEERKKGQYTCEVVHKSGPHIVMTLSVEDGSTLGITIGCVVAALVVIGGIVAIVMMKKKDYKRAEQTDTDSENSNPIARMELSVATAEQQE